LESHKLTTGESVIALPKIKSNLNQITNIKAMTNVTLTQALQDIQTLTDNGCVTNQTSMDKCLDMFFLAGASRHMSTDDIIRVWNSAYAENPQLACKILYWARDCRGGAGEKRLFQTIMSYLYKVDRDLFSQLIIHIEEYGYWKDIFKSAQPDADMLNYLATQLEESDNAGLLAKFFPRKGEWFNAMRKYKGCTPKDLRKYIVSKSQTVEQKMCAQDWSNIQYEHVPSVAMKNYGRTFAVKDEKRYTKYIENVLAGKTSINAGVLHPHELILKLERDNIDAIQAQWSNLIDYMEGSEERLFPICDVSGSMSGLPMEVSVALGLYISERNKSCFKDYVMTFSENPQFHHVVGNNIYERATSLYQADWGMSTDLEKVFKLILDKAVEHNVSPSDMPTKLLIISDMEFNQANDTKESALQYISRMYAEAGYVRPDIIFWNVNGRLGNVPAKCNTQGVGLVSGFSPSVLQSVLQGSVETPMELMLRTVNVERYDRIVIA